MKKSNPRYPYIIYGNEWIIEAGRFFRNWMTDTTKEFSPSHGNKYSVDVSHKCITIDGIYVSIVGHIMKLKPISKRYEPEADKIVIFFNKSSDVDEMWYFYPDNTVLRVSFRLEVIDKGNNITTTKPSEYSFMTCAHPNPIPVTIKDFLK